MFSILLRSWVFFIHGYADDLQLYDHCLACDTAQLSVRLAHCIEVMGQWMSSNRLELKASKTEFIWLARLAAWLDAPSTRSSSVAFQFNHPPRFAISVLTLTLAWVTRIMSPGWRGRASFHLSAPVYPSVGQWGFFARPGPSTDSDATGLLQWTPRWGTKVSPQPVDSRPASCSSFDYAASSHQQCRKRDSHHAALAWCSCEDNFQAVLARSSVSSGVGSALPDPVYFTPVSSIVGRSHLRSAVTGTVFVPRSLTSTIGPRAFAVFSPSAWNSLPVDLPDPGLSLLTFRRRLKTYLFNPPGYLFSKLPIWQLFLHCTCLWTAI